MTTLPPADSPPDPDPLAGITLTGDVPGNLPPTGSDPAAGITLNIGFTNTASCRQFIAFANSIPPEELQRRLTLCIAILTGQENRY